MQQSNSSKVLSRARGAKIVSSSKKVASVQAHPKAAGLAGKGLDDGGNILKGASHAIFCPGAVLQEHHHIAPGISDGLLQGLSYPLPAIFLFCAQIASQVGHQYGMPRSRQRTSSSVRACTDLE